MKTKVEQQTGPYSPETNSVRVELNKPFKVEPPRGWLRKPTLSQFIGSHSNDQLYLFSLYGSAELKGKLDILAKIAPELPELKETEQLILPMGTPLVDMAIDPTSGLMIIRALPIGFHISFGPYTKKGIQSEDLGISVVCFGKEYKAQTYDSIFENSTGDQRALTTSTKWQDVQTGKIGPMLFPSGADFRQIAFIIRDSAS